MKYPWYLRTLDLFGLLAALSALAYVFNDNGSPLHGLWGNLTTELIGIYISVRLIEFVVRSYQDYKEARIETVKNMRMLEDLIHKLDDFKGMRELRYFDKNLTWFKTQFVKRKKKLKANEVEDVQKFIDKLNSIHSLLPAVELLKIGEKIQLPINLSSHFSEIERLREKADSNILKETSE